MILLNLIDEIRSSGIELMENILINEKLNGSIEDYAVREILKHVHTEKKLVFENVGLNGELLEGYDGRHLVSSHAVIPSHSYSKFLISLESWPCY
jgi:hypothetical protein